MRVSQFKQGDKAVIIKDSFTSLGIPMYPEKIRTTVELTGIWHRSHGGIVWWGTNFGNIPESCLISESEFNSPLYQELV